MQIIAHKITNVIDAKKALSDGVDVLEVDVAKGIIFSKFTTQHHGVKGKFGIGENLEPVLAEVPSNKLLLDIKHASLSLTFTREFSDLLISYNIKNARICGLDWQAVSKVCQKTSCLPFYTFDNENDLEKLKGKLPKLAQPEGFSINHMLIDKDLIRNLKSDYPISEVWAWTVNDKKEAEKLAILGVDGIITDEWGKLLKSGSRF